MFRYESGQVLPLGLALLVFVMLGALMLFNTGQVASDKMRLANAADAAAYSGALWQARALNYQAYANRAMVANQVAIAQAVSLQSWMTYASIASQNFSTITALVPFVNGVTAAVDRAIAVAEPIVALATSGMLALSNAATMALSVSQTAMHFAAMANTEEIISTVASETDPRFYTYSAYGIGSTARNISGWTNFTEQYTKRDLSAMEERVEIIMASRDEFTRDRNWTFLDSWIPGPLLLTWHKIARQGQTKLIANNTTGGLEWEWVAKDTLSLHTRIIGFGWFGLDIDEFEVPVSWASAYANSKSQRARIRPCQYGRDRSCRKFTEDNHLAERAADFNLRSVRGDSLKPMLGYGGVQSFWVLGDEARDADDARLMVRVEVSMSSGELSEAGDLVASDQLAAPVIVAGNTLSSVSAAEVSYRRPAHHYLSSNQREKANLYNPYWQANLAHVSFGEKSLARYTRSGGDTPTNTQGVTQ